MSDGRAYLFQLTVRPGRYLETELRGVPGRERWVRAAELDAALWSGFCLSWVAVSWAAVVGRP